QVRNRIDNSPAKTNPNRAMYGALHSFCGQRKALPSLMPFSGLLGAPKDEPLSFVEARDGDGILAGELVQPSVRCFEKNRLAAVGRRRIDRHDKADVIAPAAN